MTGYELDQALLASRAYRQTLPNGIQEIWYDLDLRDNGVIDPKNTYVVADPDTLKFIILTQLDDGLFMLTASPKNNLLLAGRGTDEPDEDGDVEELHFVETPTRDLLGRLLGDIKSTLAQFRKKKDLKGGGKMAEALEKATRLFVGATLITLEQSKESSAPSGQTHAEAPSAGLDGAPQA